MTPPQIVPFSTTQLNREMPPCTDEQAAARECVQPLDPTSVPLCDPINDSSLMGVQRILVQESGGRLSATFQPDLSVAPTAGQRDPNVGELGQISGSFSRPIAIEDFAESIIPNYTQQITALRTRSQSESWDQERLTREVTQMTMRMLEAALVPEGSNLTTSDINLATTGHGRQGYGICLGRPEGEGESATRPAYMYLYDRRLDQLCVDGEGRPTMSVPTLPLNNIQPHEALSLIELGGIDEGHYCFPRRRRNSINIAALLQTSTEGIISELTGESHENIINLDRPLEMQHSSMYFENDHALAIAESLRMFSRNAFSGEQRAETSIQMQRDGQTLARDGQAMARDQANNLKWLYVMMGLQMYLSMRMSGSQMIHRFESVVGGVLKTTFLRTPALAVRGDFRQLAREWKGVFDFRSMILTDLTDKVRDSNNPLSETSRRILAGFDRGQSPHIILSGPSGSGKGYAMSAAAGAATRGETSVEAFEGQRPRYVQISASAIVREAGSWQNRAQELFFKAIDGLSGNRPVIVHLTEADSFASAGVDAGNRPLNLLPKLYEITEGTNPKYRNLHFVFDSTRWQTIFENGPDLLRRTAFVENAPPLPQDLRSAVQARANGAGVESFIMSRRYERVNITPAAIDAVVALGGYEAGAPPSAHNTVLDAVVNSALKLRGSGRSSSSTVDVMPEDVIRVVSEATGRTVPTVQAELATLLEGGVENNPRIQERIIETFYREYTNPRGGVINPLNPNAEPSTTGAANASQPREVATESSPPPQSTEPRPSESTPGTPRVVTESAVQSEASRIAQELSTDGRRIQFSESVIRAVANRLSGSSQGSLNDLNREMGRFLRMAGEEAMSQHVEIVTEAHFTSAYNAWSAPRNHARSFFTSGTPEAHAFWQGQEPGMRELIVDQMVEALQAEERSTGSSMNRGEFFQRYFERNLQTSGPASVMPAQGFTPAPPAESPATPPAEEARPSSPAPAEAALTPEVPAQPEAVDVAEVDRLVSSLPETRRDALAQEHISLELESRFPDALSGREFADQRGVLAQQIVELWRTEGRPGSTGFVSTLPPERFIESALQNLEARSATFERMVREIRRADVGPRAERETADFLRRLAESSREAARVGGRR